MRISDLLLLSVTSLLLAGPVVAQDSPQADVVEAVEPQRPDFRTLAEQSDLIALVQVQETRYRYTRDFPIGGYAVLRPLLIYKADRHYDLVEVDESGLGNSDACYFPTTSPYADGRRYLVFLSKWDPERKPEPVPSSADPLMRGSGETALTQPAELEPGVIEDPRDDAIRFEGHPQTCKLPALVTESNRYAVAWPVEGVDLGEEGQALVQALEFTDPDARIDTSELTGITTEQMVEDLALTREEGQLVYSRGLYLSQVRQLMGPDALVLDRSLR